MALYSGRILVRRGNEINYDPEKLMPGEWALSTDKKIVRICVSPGEVIRMATYDAFEEDMKQIEEILEMCQSIQEAVIRINEEVSEKADAVAEYTAQAKNYSESALTSANNAHTSEINAKTSETNAKLSETNAKASENAALESKEIAMNKAYEAAQSASNASQYALSADNSSASASISAENARGSEQNSALYAQEAETFRNEAEQFRNETEKFLPDNYPELVQTATKTKERVDDLEENLEIVSSDLDKTKEDLTELSSGVETNKSNIEKVSFKVDTVIEKADLRIKETASGESIHLTDSADAKVVEFALYGKAKQETTTGAQLLNYDAWKGVITTNGTSVFENNGVTITAKNNNAYTNFHAGFPTDAIIPVEEGDVITISWEEDTNTSGGIFIFINGTNTNVAVNNRDVKTLSYTVPSDVTFISYAFNVENAGDTIAYRNIMINKGSTPLPYETYTGGIASPNPNYPQDVEVAGSSGNVVVKSCGKNLINQLDVNMGGAGWWISRDFYLPKGVYTLSFKSTATNFINAKFYDKDNYLIIDAIDKQIQEGYNEFIVSLDRDAYSIHGYSNAVVIFSEIQIEKGERKTEFEPYKEISSTIPTQNGLAGIPVDSGGNYTDESGQQWICDEIVKYADGSGEYIQIVKEKIFDGTETFVAAGTNFKYNLAFNYTAEDKKPHTWSKMISNAFSLISYEEYSTENGITGVCGSDRKITFKVNRIFLNNATGINFENVNRFKEFLVSKYNEGNPVKVLYELAEPIRTPLTAEQIAEIEKLSTFYPVTNISNNADCGMKVTYIADAKKYIDNKIAELATAMVNNI